MKTRSHPWCVAALMSLLGASPELARAQETITFAFSGFIEFEQRLPVPGLSVGDQFHGTYRFDPLALGAPNDPFDESLDTEYWAITSWSVSIPSKELTFNGWSGEIAVGNDTFYQHNDRYIVTLFPGMISPPNISGHEFRFFQIDLYDPDFNGANLLQSSALPLSPPNLGSVSEADRRGRFVFNDASFQNRMTSLTVVPEPSTVALVLTGGTMAAFSLRRARRDSRVKRLAPNKRSLK